MNAFSIPSKLAAAMVASILAVGPAAALERDEFVAGWPIELPTPSQGVYDLPLKLDVYRTAQDIGQVAILDARGEPMPFYRVGAPPLTAAAEERVTLGASPLYAVPPGNAVADVSVASGADRTNVTLTRPAGMANPEVVGFVVDARQWERAPVAVELDWRELERPFLMELTIEHSVNLTDWRSVGRGSVAALSLDGVRVRHARVPVTAQAGGYYRIAVSPTVPEWFVENVTVISTQAESAPELESVRLAPSEARASDSDDALYYDAGGKLPVAALTLDFAATNSWARASLAFSDSAQGPWRTVVPTRLFYETVLEDMSLASPPVEVGRVQARYWRVAFEDGATTRAVELDLRYPQESLRFTADGVAPYLLAAGTLSDSAGPDPTFAQVWNELQAVGGTSTAALLGERTELGGPAALDEPFEFPWQRAALWAVLAFGVLAVGWMALRLGREMFSRP